MTDQLEVIDGEIDNLTDALEPLKEVRAVVTSHLAITRQGCETHQISGVEAGLELLAGLKKQDTTNGLEDQKRGLSRIYSVWIEEKLA